VQALEQRARRADLLEQLYLDVAFAVRQHIIDYRRSVALAGSTYAGGLDVEALYLQMQPHPATASAAQEREYLRQLAAWTLHLLLPEAERNSEIVRLFLREALTHSVVANTIDAVAEPDFLNRAVYLVRACLGRDGAARVAAALTLWVTCSCSRPTTCWRPSTLRPRPSAPHALTSRFTLLGVRVCVCVCVCVGGGGYDT
jgi:hypothetical protein